MVHFSFRPLIEKHVSFVDKESNISHVFDTDVKLERCIMTSEG